MQDFKIEVRFRYEGNIGYHYVFEKKKDEATAFTSAIKVAETYFRSCGWKKVELISVGLLTNPNSPPETHVIPAPAPSTPKPTRKRTVRSSGKASTAKPKRAPATRRRTKPDPKPEPTKRTRTTNRKPKR